MERNAGKRGKLDRKADCVPSPRFCEQNTNVLSTIRNREANEREADGHQDREENTSDRRGARWRKRL
jgi:hypothetical protein